MKSFQQKKPKHKNVAIEQKSTFVFFSNILVWVKIKLRTSAFFVKSRQSQ